MTKGNVVSFWRDENVLKLTVVMADCTTLNILKVTELSTLNEWIVLYQIIFQKSCSKKHFKGLVSSRKGNLMREM